MNRRTGEQSEGKTAKDQQTHRVPEGTVVDIYIFLIYIFIYIYIGGWGVSPAGPPVTGKSFRVVPCVRTCVRAVLGLVRFQANRRSCSFPFPFYRGRPFPFPFYRAGFSLFPFAPPAFPFSLVQAYVPFSLVSTMKKWIQMKSSEFT